MSFDFTTTLGVVKTNIEAVVDAEGSPVFTEVNIGRPQGPEPEGPSARIWVDRASVVGSVLNAAIELHTVNVDLYRAEWTDGAEERELQTLTHVSRVMDKFYGDFTLGGGVRNVDIAGQYGAGLSVEFEEDEVAEAPYHLATIELPLIVDSATTLVA